MRKSRQDYETTLRHLHLARQLWSSVDGRVRAARLRIQIAKLQLAHDDMRYAVAEVNAAKLITDGLGSHKLTAQLVSLQLDIDARIGRAV